MSSAFQLDSAEARARRLLEATEEGIYELDLEGRCVWSNQAAARILGYTTPDAYLGRVMHAVLHHTRPDGTPFPESECEGMKRLRAGERISQPQELLWRADGSSFWAEVRVNPILRAGEVVGGVTVFRDVSERLRREEQHRQAQRMETVGRLAAGVAHDFNNLLTVINGYAQLLLETPGLDAAFEPRLHAIALAGARASALTRQLLDYSRPGQPVLGAVRLQRVVRSAEPLLRTLLGEDITLALDLPPDLPEARCDEAQIGQALINLAVNARDAMPGGGRLTLRAGRAELDPAAARPLALSPGGYLTLAVADTGSGMSEETQARMFEPFFTTKPPSQGTGLGLAIVHTAVRHSGGAIAVASAPGQGTTVTLYLPLASALAPAARAAAAAESSVPAR